MSSDFSVYFYISIVFIELGAAIFLFTQLDVPLADNSISRKSKTQPKNKVKPTRPFFG